MIHDLLASINWPLLIIGLANLIGAQAVKLYQRSRDTHEK